jgi:hypothetical protein
MELGLPPIVVNRLKDNDDISRLRLKCEFTTLRIQCSHENSLNLQDLPERTTETRIIDGICYKVPKQTRARLPQPSESDEVIVAGISYKVPKQARLLQCQLSESDDVPELIDDGSDSDSENEVDSKDTSIEERNLLPRNHGGVGKYCFPASSARRIEEDSIIDSGCSQTAVNDEKMFNFFRRSHGLAPVIGLRVWLSDNSYPMPAMSTIILGEPHP